MTAAQIAAVTKPDLVIWPETASPVPFRSSWVYQYRLTSLIKKYKIPFLIGTIDFEDVTDGDGRAQKMYNSAFYFNRKAQLEDKFSKVHIVPFGEFVPFVDWFPFLEKVIGMGRGLTPGKGFNVIEVAPGVKAGVNICFEDVFPYVSRAFARNGANLLIVITNDAWYPKTSEPEQHLANSIFRAVENRRPMLRCGNNSCTCLITPEGRVIANSDYEFDKVLDKFIRLPNSREGLDAANKRGRNIFNFAFGVKKSPSMTFYTRFGDVFIFVCWLIFGGAIMQVLWRWREEKQMLKLAFEEPP
jgi:apolipoprotein N-acyltransferase